uniref:Uncharacterized protein n=1 Tax=Anguilla anguilla TaxID=7936 RepID=A0A0E9XP09_ANGAN
MPFRPTLTQCLDPGVRMTFKLIQNPLFGHCRHTLTQET